MRVRSALNGRWQQVPAGVRDYAAPEAARHSALAASVRSEFMRWGYAEVRTPPVEYLETIVRGAGAGIQDHLFKIVDTGGELLVLRPEMTVPIARLAATRLLPQAAGPLRLSYVADVFRGQDEGRNQLRSCTSSIWASSTIFWPRCPSIRKTRFAPGYIARSSPASSTPSPTRRSLACCACCRTFTGTMPSPAPLPLPPPRAAALRSQTSRPSWHACGTM